MGSEGYFLFTIWLIFYNLIILNKMIFFTRFANLNSLVAVLKLKQKL